MKWWYKVMIMVIAAMLVAGCGAESKKTDQPPLVKTFTVGAASGAVGSDTYSGSVHGRYETSLAFQVGGQVKQRFVDAGARVKTGDVIMTLDSRDTEEAVRAAQGVLASSQADYELAATNQKRYNTLYGEDAVSALQRDQADNTYRVAKASLEQAQAQLTAKENQQGYTSLIADRDGVISSVAAEPGQILAAGQTAAVLVGDGDLEAVISVPEQKYSKMKIGDEVPIAFWALPDVSVIGKIREISPAASTTTQTYTVKLTLQTPPAAVQLGMTATVNFADQSTVKAMFIPLTALVQQDANTFVWVVSDGKVQARSVATGTFGKDSVEIKKGLQNGDVIVERGAQKLQEGQQVRI